jgi:pimeloyl-ACP methyl ester carboxylesterase
VWSGRVFVALAALCVVLACAGFAYHSIATEGDRRAHPAPGRMIEVNGRSLHLQCTGQGGPTVILETGLGGWSSQWALIQPEVAQTTRVCSYDRAGLGWSDAGLAPRDARTIATELHALLGAADVSGPFVLVGHSNGGLYARMFAGMYPDEVVGMVLADATPVDLFERLPGPAAAMTSFGQQARMFQLLAPLGAVRLLIGSTLSDLDRFPAAARAQIAAIYALPGQWRGVEAEVDALPASMTQVDSVGGLGLLPLLVLSSTVGPGSPHEVQVKSEMDAEMAALSSNSRQIRVDGATHTGLAVNPDHASATSAAIREVVDSVRSSRLLGQ